MELVDHHYVKKHTRKKGAIHKLIFECICLDFFISIGAELGIFILFNGIYQWNLQVEFRNN